MERHVRRRMMIWAGVKYIADVEVDGSKSVALVKVERTGGHSMGGADLFSVTLGTSENHCRATGEAPVQRRFTNMTDALEWVSKKEIARVEFEQLARRAEEGDSA